MVEANYNAPEEAEDPPESLKTPWKLWKEWKDPLHKLHERLDTEHRIISYRWELEMLDSFMHDGPRDEDHFEAHESNEAAYKLESYLFESGEESHLAYSGSVYMSEIEAEEDDIDDGLLEIIEEIEKEMPQTSERGEELEDESRAMHEDKNFAKANYFTLDTLVKALRKSNRRQIIDAIGTFFAQAVKKQKNTKTSLLIS